ncbi:unnamed protein product [Linum tenue]|uniref:Uncharacterized protein n=1 Tax=Linum tenue TaxID=586396 RepID=A0AAV0NMZ0_9ROSI|nr:unnamed protein product [Linum tenue]
MASRVVNGEVGEILGVFRGGGAGLDDGEGEQGRDWGGQNSANAKTRQTFRSPIQAALSYGIEQRLLEVLVADLRPSRWSKVQAKSEACRQVEVP